MLPQDYRGGKGVDEKGVRTQWHLNCSICFYHLGLCIVVEVFAKACKAWAVVLRRGRGQHM